MVQLLDNKDSEQVSDYLYFNSTMVQLLAPIEMKLQHHLLYFNSTMVQLLVVVTDVNRYYFLISIPLWFNY